MAKLGMHGQIILSGLSFMSLQYTSLQHIILAMIFL